MILQLLKFLKRLYPGQVINNNVMDFLYQLIELIKNLVKYTPMHIALDLHGLEVSVPGFDPSAFGLINHNYVTLDSFASKSELVAPVRVSFVGPNYFKSELK